MIGKWTKVRLAAFGTGLIVLFCAIGSRAYNLQIKERDRLRGLAEEQYLREIELPPRRGRILDRNGAELASTADVDSIYCNPRQLPAGGAARLARGLSLDAAELGRKLAGKRYFAWVKRKVTPDEAAVVRALALPGVALAREPRRFYPNRTLAATVMGHAGSDGRGLDGLELAFDKALSGTASSVQGVRDALGRDLMVDGMVDADAGAGRDVTLTIDRYLTFITERALGEAVQRTRAKAAVSITLDPRTGDVLAMASLPTFNPNDPGDAMAQGARNRAVTDTYEPGSTMKTFTISAALDGGAVRPDDRFDCLMGKMVVGKYQIHDTHPYGILTVADVYKHSSNIGATRIARRLGRDRLAEKLRAFGFGAATGISLPGERSGVLRPVARWGDIGFANVAFGQGLTVTPLQMVAGVAAIAAGGTYRAPRLVARVVGADGKVEVPPVAPARRVMSEGAAKQMNEIMQGVTETGGTARQAAIDGYRVAGKTGTAQKVSGGRYDSSRWVASFFGFAPADDPRVATIVIIDEPQGVHLGGVVAAPVWKEIVEQALRYLHVPPAAPAVGAKAPVDARPVVARKAIEASPEAESPGSDVATAGEAEDAVEGAEADEEVVDSAGEAARGDLVTVPSFRGLTIGEAIRVARAGGVELGVEGSGVARAQVPEPGPAARGTLCRVTFGSRGSLENP